MPLLVTLRIPASIGAIEAAAEGLTGLNYRMMTVAHVGGGGFPALYESGLRYRPEKFVNGRRKEHWQSAVELLKSGEGDCEDLAAYRAAELRMYGEPAMVAIVRTRRGTFHAVVRRIGGELDGAIEDPSRYLLALEARAKGAA